MLNKILFLATILSLRMWYNFHKLILQQYLMPSLKKSDS